MAQARLFVHKMKFFLKFNLKSGLSCPAQSGRAMGPKVPLVSTVGKRSGRGESHFAHEDPSNTPLTPPPSAKIGLHPRKLMPLSLAEFVERWKASTLTERAAAQSHFIDLCEVLGPAAPRRRRSNRRDASPLRSTSQSSTAARALPMCGSAASSHGSTRASTRT